MDIKGLQILVEYLLRNQNSVETIILDFGEVSNDNGYGTVFLKPKNTLFKVFWVHHQNGKVESVGFGGTHLGLNLKDLYSFYNEYNEGYSRYDNKYFYIFFLTKDNTHTIKIYSPHRLMEGRNIIDNIDVNGIEIILR